MPKFGGTPVVLATGLPDEPAGLATDATHVYVAAVAWGSEAAEKAGVVARVPKSGGDLPARVDLSDSLRTETERSRARRRSW